MSAIQEIAPSLSKSSGRMPRVLASGDEAVAWGALDAGIVFSSAYPGTPATDIQETVLRDADPKRTRALWSVNEKVAYESALAVALAGQRALVSMKQVGLNVAADAFINSCTAGVNGGLVLAVGDDPECHSSQHKQDTRWYRGLTGTLLLEPANAQEAYSMTYEAFALSERFRLPVILRLTSRTAYGCTPVTRQPGLGLARPLDWPKQPERFFIVPQVSRRHFARLFELQTELAETIVRSRFSRMPELQATGEAGTGILCTGAGYAFAQEFADDQTPILKVAGEPFPDTALRSFVHAHRQILVLEEGDPMLEERARSLAGKFTAVRGRLSGDLQPVGELRADQVRTLITGEQPVVRKKVRSELPARLPEICKPCGYHKVFGAIKQLEGLATPSDIGCNSLGGLPPYSVMDGVWSMGSSIGVACGLAALGHPRVLAIIGDSTFFHAGLPATIEAIHEKYKLTILLLDNGTAAMTGGQGVAHRAGVETQKRVCLVKLIEALGLPCTPFDPHHLGEAGIGALIEESFKQDGPKLLLYRSQCGLHSPGYFTDPAFSLSKRRVEA